MQDTDALTRLALDLSWSWNHSADEIWKKLDAELWELGSVGSSGRSDGG
jgi:starch phosphorylase